MNPVLKYRVLLLGENFHIPCMPDIPADDDGPLTAFATTRFVEATTPLHAAKYAFALVRDELAPHHIVQPGATKVPTLTAVSVRQLSSFDGLPVPCRGFTFVTQFAPPSLLARLRTWAAELWYRHGGTRPWSYSEPF